MTNGLCPRNGVPSFQRRIDADYGRPAAPSRTLAIGSLALISIVPVILAQACSSPSDACPADMLSLFREENPEAEIVACKKGSDLKSGGTDGVRQQIEFSLAYRNPTDEKVRYEIWSYQAKDDGPLELRSRFEIQQVSLESYDLPESHSSTEARGQSPVHADEGVRNGTGDSAEQEAPIHVQGDVQPPEKLHAPAPLYTEAARAAQIEGSVTVQAVIDEKGNVARAVVLRGLPLGLSEAAVEAIRQWKFKPASLDGEPVAVFYNLKVNFRLK